MFTAYLPTALLPWAKSINAGLLAIALICLHGLTTGEWDVDGLEAAIGGLLLAGAVFATPNAQEAPAPDGDNSTVTKP